MNPAMATQNSLEINRVILSRFCSILIEVTHMLQGPAWNTILSQMSQQIMWYSDLYVSRLAHIEIFALNKHPIAILTTYRQCTCPTVTQYFGRQWSRFTTMEWICTVWSKSLCSILLCRVSSEYDLISAQIELFREKNKLFEFCTTLESSLLHLP